MAYEKIDAVIVGAGASGSVFASVLTRAGKKVVLLDNGPDWQLTDLISSDIWGRRVKPAGAPVLLEGNHPFAAYTNQAGWGVGARRCTTSQISRVICQTTSRSIVNTIARTIGRSRMKISHHSMTGSR
jgi:choline dehydrogenase-like flavoprotein